MHGGMRIGDQVERSEPTEGSVVGIDPVDRFVRSYRDWVDRFVIGSSSIPSVQLVSDDELRAYLVNPPVVTASEIEQSGLRLPAAYQRFLTRFHVDSLAIGEICFFGYRSLRDLVGRWEAVWRMDPGLLGFAMDANGGSLFAVRGEGGDWSGGQAPVVLRDPDTGHLKLVAESFGAFLETLASKIAEEAYR